MIGHFAALLPRFVQKRRGRRALVSLTFGAMGALIACGFTTTLAPTLPAPTPATQQTPGQGPTRALDVTLTSYPTPDTPPVTATPPQPTHLPNRATQSDETGSTPTLQTLQTPPAPRPTATSHPPAPTPQPSVTPTLPLPSPTTPARSDLSVHTGQVTLAAYPYQEFLREELDATYGITVQRLDRGAYEAATPRPSPRDFQTLVIENAHLRLTFLPELGGRLYSTVVKSTGQEIFYHNPVVKPSRYGPLLPIEDNWWLGVGGMEWAFPVQEHGYAWGLPWTYDVASTPQSVTVTLRDSTQPGRVRAEVLVTLAADSATFAIQPRLINDTNRTLPVQFWLSAALAPGAPSVSPDTRIIVPVNQVVVHSRGETGWALPAPRTSMPWPVVAGYDLSRYDQWANYLGFFVPYMQSNFMAIYSPSADLAVTRIVAPGQIPGHKLFAFGLDFSDRSYTDNGSQYIEMWGGANASFWPEDDIQLVPGGALEWRETWWPMTGLGGLTFANEWVAFNLLNGSSLRILSARQMQVTLTLSADGVELSHASLSLSPTQPVERPIPTASSSPIQIQLIAPNGDLVADFQASLHSVGISP
jgi:hypothetical protein